MNQTKNVMTVAEKIKEYYKHEDFEEIYVHHLIYDNSAAINRIIDIAKNRYEFEEFYGSNINLSYNEAEQVLDYIQGNLDLFVRRLSGYYVGDTSIASISFGEQEEQLTGLHNHKTGEPYNINYLRKAFREAGYYVGKGEDFAYLDLSSEGLYIELLAEEIPLIVDKIKN